MKKLLSLLLAALMCLPLLASCASNEANDPASDSTAASPDSSVAEAAPEEEITRANYPDTLPDGLDFGGETTVIHARGDQSSVDEVAVEELTGESVNDAIYERNLMVSDRLNVALEVYAADGWENYNNSVSALRASIMSSDGAYDIVAGWSARIPALSLEGILLNLTEMNYLDFEQPWWNQSAVEELLIAGKLYFITGNIALSMLQAMYVYAFNQKVASDNNVEDLYSVVNEHRWTIDYVNNLVSGLFLDLDGDGASTNADSYGLVTSSINDADAYMQGFRVSMVTRDEEGIPVLDVDEDRFTTIVEKVYTLYWNNTGTFADTYANTEINAFKADRSLFATMVVSSVAASLADMESDYGVLPYPLLDEGQTEYGTRVQDALSLWCMPIDVKNADKSAAVLEAMAAQSYRTVTPAYFDVALKNRYSRDRESAQMMDLIQDSILINFESLYNESIGNPWFVLRNLMPQKKDNFSSYWATNKKVIAKTLEKAMQKLRENG